MRRCSGTVPYRFRKGRHEVCIVRSSDGVRWVFPKGGVEPMLSQKSNAVKETWEEAGLIGRINRILGRVDTPANTTAYFSFLVVAVAEVYPETHRERQWLAVNDARELLDPTLQVLLDLLLKQLS